MDRTLPDLRMVMIGYGGHMSCVASDSLDFKYSVPFTDLVSDHLSQVFIEKIWSPYGGLISTAVAQAAYPRPPTKLCLPPQAEEAVPRGSPCGLCTASTPASS